MNILLFFYIDWELTRNKPLINFMKFAIYFKKQSIDVFVRVKVVSSANMKHIRNKLKIINVNKKKKRP